MSCVLRVVVVLFLSTPLISAPASVESPTLFQNPTVNATHVVFEYAGDLWAVPREGGDAKRLTVGIGAESDPLFSPDGSMLAFTGQYDGNTDVFVMPAAGGTPRRLTYHPDADYVVGWAPDGKSVLFSSARLSAGPFPRLFTVSLTGGLPQALPLPMGERASFSADGTRLAYEPLSQWQPEWKRYHGGQTDKIWIARLDNSSIEALPRQNSNDRFPMWVADKVYFLSDREGHYTLYAFDTEKKSVQQLIPNGGMDIKSASAWQGDRKSHPTIAFEQFGKIHLYDVKDKTTRQVPVRVTADLLSLRPRFENVGDRIYASGISPTGARAVFEARGEILTVPAEKGDARNITNTPGINERDPAWSPDGKWIAYFTDESGEYALHVRDQKGVGEPKKFALPPTFYYGPTWSPDSKKIAFTNKKLELWYLDIEKGETVKVDKNQFGLRNAVIDPAWSPDSKWITYVRQLDNHLRAVFLYSLESGKSHQVTDGLSDARNAVFDPDGKYLFFTASTNLGPAFSFAEMSTFPYQWSRSVYAAVLANNLPSPVAPESDEEKTGDEKKDDKAEKNEGEQKAESGAPESDQQAADKSKDASADKKSDEKKAPEPVRIDLEGLDQRIIALPIPSRDYVGLAVGKKNLLLILEAPPTGAGGSGPPPGATLHKFDLEKRKLDKVIDGLRSFQVSANGEKALYRTGPPNSQNWFIASLSGLGGPGGGPGGKPPDGDNPNAPKALKMAELQTFVDPMAEWRQMYREVWRGERDFFYDPNAHGLDLKAAEAMYEPYLGAVAHRNDLNYLFTEMLNQLTVGHMFIGGGDIPSPKFVGGGLLGCDYAVENGRYRFLKIYSGENWNPDLQAPLTQPGVNVKAGEYLLAVNGQNVTATDNVYSFFEAKAGKQVVIKVGPNPDGADAREVTVVPVGSERGLRNRDWIENNRRKVEQLSGGRLAYVYVPNTGGGGYDSFNRYFFAQTQKQGAVIDERFNQGGALADYIVEYLTRPQLNMIYFREGRDIPTPLGAIYGPKAMIINELAGSGGDALPWYFRKMSVGPLVGKRTWGGLIASFRLPRLMDGGFVTAPDAAIYGLNGDWEVENVGVGPDLEVEYDPAAWRKGQDPQLEAAVKYLLEQLEKNPPPQYKRPPFPNYHRKPADAMTRTTK